MSDIDYLKGQSLSFDELKFMMGHNQSKRCRFLLYDDLQNFKSVDELMALGAVIILLEIEAPRAPKVGHFICLLDHGTHIEHFDSYGLRMDEELDYTQERHQTMLFKNSPKKILDNTKRLQMFREDIQTCGRWVVTRVLLRNIELDQFLNIFDHLKPQTPDEMVTVMTLLLNFDK